MTPEDRTQVERDWLAIAKLAGEHGIRYRTNSALNKFLAALFAPAEPSAALSDVERLRAALLPFVRSVEGWGDDMFPAYIATEQEPSTASAYDLTLAEVQEARAALSASSPAEINSPALPELPSAQVECLDALTDRVGTSATIPATAPAVVPHEYIAGWVSHGEMQCRWCCGTNRENAVIAPNHCKARADNAAALATTATASVEVVQGDLEAAAKALGYKTVGDATDYRNTGAEDRAFERMAKLFRDHRLGISTPSGEDGK